MPKVTITKNRPYKLTLTIKESGSPTPIVTDPNDEVWFYFRRKNHPYDLILKKRMYPVTIDCEEEENPTPNDAVDCYDNGRYTLVLDECDTTLFPSLEMFGEDGRPSYPTLKGSIAIDFDSDPREYADIIINDIYVSDIGIEDPDCYSGGD